MSSCIMRVLNFYHNHIYMLARLRATHLLYYLWALSVVKLCRPLGACHVVKIKIHLHVHSHMLLLLRKYASTYIHSFSSPKPPKNILLLIRERMAKNISVFPLWNRCSSYLVTTTCYIISGDECSKKREKIQGNKKGQVLSLDSLL